ncbi:arsenic resistance N-acetyltransferase ArsN2 [Pseudomonas anguilliseptica]|uniref:Amino-acid N-acetyltransferase n=1 Tax=Pseudomonas anguilliseptica TaxID=53406 RepID=A0A1H5HUH0_PSEAG|nr:arsenic resistance N-acetyltransferase ArsN2 [Pseudomonas anguilliseptica]SEE31341.1 amino-acid N-acetyltransferase [Pseudomonas anguilliseptica]
MNVYRHPPAAAAKALLAAAGLPTADLVAEHFAHFIAAGPTHAPDALIGLQPYGEVALLRSLVVSPAARGMGYGGALVAEVEAYAQQLGVHELYLLTNSAEAFFSRRGYSSVERAGVPEAIRQTAEFSSLCPASAVYMHKRIETR